jgi:hypothetical protein
MYKSKLIHFGGPNHGKIIHNSDVPNETNQLGKCFLIIDKNSVKDQAFHDTIKVWTKLLSDPELFSGTSIKKKQPLMKHESEGPHRYSSVCHLLNPKT